MNKKISFIGIAVVLLLNFLAAYNLNTVQAVSQLGESKLILYDAASGEIPDSSVMGFTAFPPEGASLSFDNGSSVLDSTITGTDTYAGFVASGAITTGFPILDSSTGFQVDFTLQVERESHDSNHRSGMSVIVLDSAARGIEMSFWTNQIWVQNDDTTGSLFTQGEAVTFDTTASPVAYQITMVGEIYTLNANGQTILTGPLRDYSAFDRFPDPYETPNFLFLGDDSTSAEARVRLAFLSVTGTQPVTPTSAVTETSLPQSTSTPVPSVTAIPSATPTPVKPVNNF
jgi:hypothetical protein